MSRVVLATFGSLGDLHPMIAIGLGLRERGHTVVIASHQEYRGKVEALGFEFHPIRPRNEALNEPEKMALLMDAKKGTERVIRAVCAKLPETYSDLMAAAQNADFIVVGEVVYAGRLVAEKLGIPWAFCALAPTSLFSAYDLPTLPIFSGLTKLPLLGLVSGRGVIALAQWLTRSWVEPIYQFRRELGLPSIENPILRGKLSPYLVLAMFSSLLGSAQPDWPSSTVITGFSFYDGESLAIAPELQRFLDAGEPPIVFTLGSAAVGDPGNFFTESLAAAQQLNRRAVLLMGKNPPPANLPPTIAAFDYAPYSQVFPHACAIVHQGGVGTTAQALRSGRPTLVMPYSHDQPDNAARVERLGTSRTIARRHYTAPRVVRELSELLNNPSYSDRAAEVGQIVQRENGVRIACDAIEDQLDVRAGEEQGKANSGL